MHLTVRATLRSVAIIGICCLVNRSIASAQFLRVVTYNIDADTGGAHGSLGGDISGPGLPTILQAIGNATLAGHAQPIDVLALQEINSVPATTLQFIVNQLNGIYGAGTYAYDSTSDPTTGGTGGGPNGLVYNTSTVQLLGDALAPKAIGIASGGGAPRAPMRYTLAPIGYNDHSADFSIYASHAKANSGSNQTSNIARRDVEAHELRDDAATLGSQAHVIYSGDFNILTSSEAAYQTMISPSVDSGVGQAVDVANPTNDWTQASTFKGLFTESATSDSARFDFQFMTSPMINQPGMQLVPGSYTVFGNGGNIYHQSVTNAANSAALVDLGQSPYTPAYGSAVLSALTTATDHLPVVADYSFATAVGIPGDYDHSGLVDNADYILWTNSFGSTTTLAADGNHDGVVDAADYSVWRDNLSSPGAGAGGLTGTAVPEPNAAVMLLFGGCLLGLSVGRLKGWTRRN